VRQEDSLKALCHGWCLGSEEFKQPKLEEIDDQLAGKRHCRSSRSPLVSPGHTGQRKLVPACGIEKGHQRGANSRLTKNLSHKCKVEAQPLFLFRVQEYLWSSPAQFRTYLPAKSQMMSRSYNNVAFLQCFGVACPSVRV
jgi:hypothetical protein